MGSTLERALQSFSDLTCSFPGSPAYAEVVNIWARSASAPKVVVHCRDTRDIRAAIHLARDAGLPLSARAGGHDWVGRALCDGVVLDLTPMRQAEISADGKTLRVAGGARGVDVYPQTDARGLAPVTGSVGLVGIAGLTLGGGYGPLIGVHGLACDNLVSADLVLADGSEVTASATQHPDLFWALKGGGGNFGIVTALEVKLHALPSIYSGMALFPYEQAKALFDGCAAYRLTAPDELDAQVATLPAPDGSVVVALTASWIGDPAQGEAMMAPMLQLGTPIMANFASTPFGVSRSFFDAHIHLGLHTWGDGSWFDALTPELTDILLDQVDRRPSPGCSVLTHDFYGAATKVAPDATPFGLRSPHFMLELVAQIHPDQGDGTAERLWVRETLERTAHLRLPGGYPNMMTPEDPTRVAHAFGNNATRLAAIKRQYDPDGIFNGVALPKG